MNTPKKIKRNANNHRTLTIGNAQIHSRDHRFDELIVNDSNGSHILHLEWMHENEYWMGVYGKDGRRVSIRLTSDTPIHAKISEENL
jgi:hypothetical protein